jgi:hypothetical protein
MERPDLRKWPAYYDSISRQLVPLGATTTLDTSTTSGSIIQRDCVNSRFIAVTKNATSFQDSSRRTRPSLFLKLQHYLVLRSAMPTEAMQDVTISDSCHVRSLYRSFTAVGGGLIVHNTEFHCPDYSLHELLQQENILVANDGGHKDDRLLLVGIGTETEIIWDCQGVATRLPNAVSPRGRIRPHVRTVPDSLHSLLRHQNVR